MSRLLAPVFAALAIGAGVFAWMQFSSAADLRKQVAALTAERDAALKSRAELAALKTAADTAQENIARLTKERDAALATAKSLPAGGPPMPPPPNSMRKMDETGGKGMMEGIAKMFSTEDGRKMMRSQMAMGLKMQYGSLAKDLNLDPKVADQVLSLLGDRQMALTDATFSSMKDGGLDEAGIKDIGAKSESIQKEYNDKLKAVLGEQGMTKLNDYERTLSDRMMLNMHEQQFAASGAPLETAQRDSLLQIMKDERLKTPTSVFDTTNGGDPSKALSVMRDDAAIEKWISQEEDYQRRVLQSATQSLNPDQVNALRESFKQQLEMQRFGVKMSKEMFKGSGASGAVIVTPSVTNGSPAK